MKNPLHIVAVEEKKHTQSNIESSPSEVQAKMEREWLIHPEKMAPKDSAQEQERIQRTWVLIQSLEKKDPSYALDIGCGSGLLSQKLHEFGYITTASDISSRALEYASSKLNPSIQQIRTQLPKTSFEESGFDLVLCCDLIAYLPRKEHRLALSELNRIVKNDGHIILSTPIDLNSEDALERLVYLLQTEFTILDWTPSYHALSIRLLHFLKAPKRFSKGYQDPHYSKKQLKKMGTIGCLWYRLNSLPLIAHLWQGVAWIFSPLIHLLQKSRLFLLTTEQVTRLFSNKNGISHVIFLLKTKPLFEETPHEPLPERQPFFKTSKWD